MIDITHEGMQLVFHRTREAVKEDLGIDLNLEIGENNEASMSFNSNNILSEELVTKYIQAYQKAYIQSWKDQQDPDIHMGILTNEN